jgi:hypothetical protein
LELSELFSLLSHEGRTAIYFIASAYALYFYHTKIGFKLTVSYEVGSDAYTDSQITKLIISNHKDKTVPIWSIFAVLDNDFKVEVYKPNEPLVLESGEAVAVVPEKYTLIGGT